MPTSFQKIYVWLYGSYYETFTQGPTTFDDGLGTASGHDESIDVTLLVSNASDNQSRLGVPQAMTTGYKLLAS
jgi:hypothetical protein